MSHNILIVEDNADHQFIVTAHLKASGYHVFSAESGLKGIKLMSEEKIHLVILDLWLPKLDGMSFLKNLRSYPEWSTIPVIITSGIDQNQAVPGLMELGISKYFVKPFEPKELILAIRTLLS